MGSPLQPPSPPPMPNYNDVLSVFDLSCSRRHTPALSTKQTSPQGHTCTTPIGPSLSLSCSLNILIDVNHNNKILSCRPQNATPGSSTCQTRTLVVAAARCEGTTQSTLATHTRRSHFACVISLSGEAYHTQQSRTNAKHATKNTSCRKWVRGAECTGHRAPTSTIYVET